MVRLAAPFRLRRPRIRRSALRPFRGPGGPASDLAALDGPGDGPPPVRLATSLRAAGWALRPSPASGTPSRLS